MSNVLPLLKVMLNNTVYTKYSQYIKDTVKDNKELNLLFMYLENLHQKYNRDINWEEYALFVLINCPEKDKPVLSELLSNISDIDTNSMVLEDLLNEVIQRQKAYNIAIAALEVSEGRKDFSDLLVLTNGLECASPTNDLDSLFVTHDLEELCNDSIKQSGLRWRLQTLNRMLGSLRKGDFGFIFARPETGKTTFLASEITNFATQAAEKHLGPVLLFCNEESGTKVQLRMYQAMLGLTLSELYSDVKGNRQRYMERGGDRIRIFDSAAIHRKQVEQLVRELEPSCIIFDQLDKIKGFTDDREDLRLGGIYIWAREIAKQYCPVIGVSQADASGEGKKWLTMDNVANAKTAKQAEADWILGIGKTHNDAESHMRFLSISKNKLHGDVDTDPELRHGKQQVTIKPEIARYED